MPLGEKLDSVRSTKKRRFSCGVRASRAGSAILAVLLACAGAYGQSSGDPVLRRIYERATEDLKGLPNYTCTETIERTVRRESKKDYKPLDTVRLEIAYVGGKEMVAWPGAGKFEDKSIDEFVGRTGAIGNGNFALHTNNLFRTAAPVYTARAEETRNGRRTIRYDFRVPRERSAFHIASDAGDVVVGYHGSFWVDAETLDLVRLQTEADDIPQSIKVRASRDTMEYARMRIGESDFLLPSSSELVMVDREGTENRNVSRFTGCRKYTGESTVSFGDPEAAPERAGEPEAVRLPAGLTLEATLDSALDPAKVAIGDPVSATLQRQVKKGTEIFAPKGAVLSGRITRFEERASREGRFYVVGFEFHSLKAANLRAELAANLEEVTLGARYYVPFATDPSRGASVWTYLVRDVGGTRPGESLLFVRASRGGAVLPAGFRMVCQTVAQ